MADELAYVLITPYSLLKSRTGGIISRLLLLTDLEFAGARMYWPSDAFVDAYMDTVKHQEIEPELRKHIVGYLNDYFRRKNRFNISNRTFLLLFRGENAIEKLKRDVVGSLTAAFQGDSVRGTYGDYLVGNDGRVEFFEPAVLVATDAKSANAQLKVLADFAESDGGIIESAVNARFKPDEKPETTLVIIKPDAFRRRSARPGNIIDIFSKTGLYVVGAKLLRMSVAQAEEFYQPLLGLFINRLKGNVERILASRVQGSFGFNVTPEHVGAMSDILKEENARFEFDKIVEYMSGRSARTIKSPEERTQPGMEKALALLYRGVDAVKKIRERLGSTDPSKAAEGTVRSDFGFDLMKNGAHASDSVESAERERKIIGLWPGYEDGKTGGLIRSYLAK
jgi:nucleoside diphosphate kinase